MFYRLVYPVLLLGILLCIWLSFGQAGDFDRIGLLFFRDEQGRLLGPEWGSVIIRDITAFGSNWILLFGMAVMSLMFTLRRYYLQSIELLTMTLGGVFLSMGAKYLFQRPRPELVPHLIEVYTPSFPSGHATMSMVCFLGGALVIARMWPESIARRALITVAVLSSLVVGASRVMLGVHWPSDVLAGWLLGIFWVLVVHQYCSHYRLSSTVN
ncbi:MAG: phosphatase PAP2 family protein [Marinomonas atlantica]|nr:phosphatase PAP2 family protein [Marinomonas atlantica]